MPGWHASITQTVAILSSTLFVKVPPTYVGGTFTLLPVAAFNFEKSQDQAFAQSWLGQSRLLRYD